MKLYRISDKGELENIQSVEFNSNEVYLIDDDDKLSIYVWVGLNVPQYMKDITAAYARRFEKERDKSTKIHIMKENREFGSFLAMKDLLKKGKIPGETVDRRPELILQKSTHREPLQSYVPLKTESKISEKRIIAWFNQLKALRTPIAIESVKKEKQEEVLEEIDFETQIREAAYYLSLEKYSYNDLCWLLGEKIQKIDLGMPSLEDIRTKAEEVYHSSSTYDELCWLNAELDILIIKGLLEKKKVGFN